MFIINLNMFDILLLYVSQLHINLFIVLYNSKSLAKCLLQLFKSVVWMVLNIVFSPFKDIISESKTTHVDDINFQISPLDLMAFLNTLM